MNLIQATRADELLSVDHPHFGKIHGLGSFKSTLGLIGGTSRKAVALEDFSTGKGQTVALDIDPARFMITIAKSFVLVTLKEGAGRIPIIQKQWKQTAQTKGTGPTQFYGTVNSYIDSDGLTWKHSFMRETDEDELVGFGKDGQELLLITLETLR